MVFGFESLFELLSKKSDAVSRCQSKLEQDKHLLGKSPGRNLDSQDIEFLPLRGDGVPRLLSN